MSFSIWLISAYIGIHLLAGLAVGVLAARIPGWIEQEIKKKKKIYLLEDQENKLEIKTDRKRRFWLQKPSAYVIIIFAGILVILSFLFPEISETQGLKAVVMIVRSTCILILWYSLVGPYLLKLSQKYFRSKQNKYAEEVQKILNILVPIRYIIFKTWNESQRFSGLERIKKFILMSLVTILSTDFYTNENN